jgi:hypothetical protein
MPVFYQAVLLINIFINSYWLTKKALKNLQGFFC